MATVYVVTSGEYSDYGIHSVFSTRELADEYLAPRLRPGVVDDNYQIEEWELDAPSAPAQYHYRAAGWVYHETLDVEIGKPRFQEGPVPDRHIQTGTTGTQHQRGKTWISVSDEDPERAVKILHDKVAEVKANLAGLT